MKVWIISFTSLCCRNFWISFTFTYFGTVDTVILKFVSDSMWWIALLFHEFANTFLCIDHHIIICGKHLYSRLLSKYSLSLNQTIQIKWAFYSCLKITLSHIEIKTLHLLPHVLEGMVELQFFPFFKHYNQIFLYYEHSIICFSCCYFFSSAAFDPVLL